MTNNVLKRKLSLRDKRKKRVRGKIFGTKQTPRVSIYKSNKTLYVQAINDEQGLTITQSNGLKLGLKANKEGAVSLAKDFAVKLNESKIEQVVFDRNGYLFHGVVATFANALRENGIKL